MRSAFALLAALVGAGVSVAAAQDVPADVLRKAAHVTPNAQQVAWQEMEFYYRSVGRNAVLLLNVPPDRRGLFHENDVARLKELRSVLDETFRHDLAAGKIARAGNVPGGSPVSSVPGATASSTPGDAPNNFWLEVDLGQPTTFDRALVQEQITVGQRVEQFALEAWDGKAWRPVTTAGTIGYKRLLRFPAVTTTRVRLTILQSRGAPAIRDFQLFKASPKE